MSLWQQLLRVIQSIYTAGGGFTAFTIDRSIVELIDQAATAGDAVAIDGKKSIERSIAIGKWPHDPQNLSAVIEKYNELLFYLLAQKRGVVLRRIPEIANKTPDYAADASHENIEVKTLNFSGGQYAFPKIFADGLAAKEEAEAGARAKGIGTGVSSVNPHGTASTWPDVMQRVMRQIGQNIKSGQFEERPTILVIALPRTSIHGDAQELQSTFVDPHFGTLSGQLWTIAAHKAGDVFHWFDDATGQTHATALDQNGVLRDFPFVRGIIFLHTIRNELGDSDNFDATVLDRAFELNGVGNASYTPLANTSIKSDPTCFNVLCDAKVIMP